jgi:hypothetical protein
MGVLLEEGIGRKLAGLAAGGAEEIAVDVIGDAGRFDIVVQTLIEAMMTVIWEIILRDFLGAILRAPLNALLPLTPKRARKEF